MIKFVKAAALAVAIASSTALLAPQMGDAKALANVPVSFAAIDAAQVTIAPSVQVPLKSVAEIPELNNVAMLIGGGGTGGGIIHKVPCQSWFLYMTPPPNSHWAVWCTNPWGPYTP